MRTKRDRRHSRRAHSARYPDHVSMPYGLNLDPIDGGGGPLAEVVAVRRGNTCDEPDAAEEFFFAADAVTAEHHLRGPRTLEEVRQHSRREVQLRLVQLQALHLQVHVRAGR